VKSSGRPTRDDVARHAKISGATVSRVLSGRSDHSISEKTRAKVLEAAKELGYVPNSSARALTSGKTGVVGFWMSLQYSRYRSTVLDRMRLLLRGTELAMAVSDVDEEYSYLHSFDRALRVPVDGIIAFDNSASVQVFAQEYEKLAPAIPFVSMGAYWSELRSYVGIDLRKGADLAMEHVLSTGRRKVAYVAPWTSDLIDSGPRFESYRDAMRSAGLEPHTVGVESDIFEHIKTALDQLLDSGKIPDALVCMNDELAVAAEAVLQGRGLKVGEDVAIIGFDGIAETAHCPVPITTVRQPIEEMCALAWSFMKGQMEQPSAKLRQAILVPELIVRESTQPR
jgi:DNA-binding LacI/PurR family transcriptional regulator